mmetsp:Transcript_15904/g.31896  ORF Transcript_15904/g.31896 Transcript_15904/m.31896 type:complete len:176 (-) Transcript_15904:6690-7217(-)
MRGGMGGFRMVVGRMLCGTAGKRKPAGPWQKESEFVRRRREYEEKVRELRKAYRQETVQSSSVTVQRMEEETRLKVQQRGERELAKLAVRKQNYEAHCAKLAEIAEAKRGRVTVHRATWSRKQKRENEAMRGVLIALIEDSPEWMTPETLEIHVSCYLDAVFGGSVASMTDRLSQ